MDDKDKTPPPFSHTAPVQGPLAFLEQQLIEAHSEGHKEGFEQGSSEGYVDGRSDGYKQGITDARHNMYKNYALCASGGAVVGAAVMGLVCFFSSASNDAKPVPALGPAEIQRQNEMFERAREMADALTPENDR